MDKYRQQKVEKELTKQQELKVKKEMPELESQQINVLYENIINQFEKPYYTFCGRCHFIVMDIESHVKTYTSKELELDDFLAEHEFKIGSHYDLVDYTEYLEEKVIRCSEQGSFSMCSDYYGIHYCVVTFSLPETQLKPRYTRFLVRVRFNNEYQGTIDEIKHTRKMSCIYGCAKATCIMLVVYGLLAWYVIVMMYLCDSC